MITADELVDAARELKGIPWRHMGRTRLGLDCIGMVIFAMRTRRLDLPQLAGVRDRPYSRRVGPELLEIVQSSLAPSPARMAGTFALFKFYGEKHPRHVGILTGESTLIHCNSRYGGVMEHGLRAHWARWLHSVWLLPGISYPDCKGYDL